MFERPWHREVLAVLRAFDAEQIARCEFLFGGGTRLVLDLGEYRESHDIDFVCSAAAGYADLRLIARNQGYAGLFTPEGIAELSFPREIRTDQYGIRFPVVHGHHMMKVEFIREGRIALASGTRPEWSPVECLSPLDCYAEKILANCDRWPDRQVLSRDLIDLAVLRARWGPIPQAAWQKAESAYKSAVRSDLEKALAAFQDELGYQRRCFEGLRVEEPRSILKALAQLAEEI